MQIVKASGLKGVDRDGLSDPYVKATVMRGGEESSQTNQIEKTDYIKNCVDPVWKYK